MRFKKGSKVEVLNEKEVPSGAWQCAVIISGNGHTYSVRYGWSPNVEDQAVVERVPRKAIRPCPPPVQREDIWAAGDVVEVFDVGFWKMAKVVMVFDENYCLTRLLGSFEEFRIHKSRIRVRQVLKDDKWIVIGKGPGSGYRNQMSSPVSQMKLRIKLPAGNYCLPPEHSSCEDSHIVSSTSLKRTSPCCSPHSEAYPRKMRAIAKESGLQEVFLRSPSSLLKKLDAVAYPRENLGETYMHASLIFPSTRYYEKEKGNLNGADSCFERSSEVSDLDTDACSIESIGSCSVISNSSNKLSGYNLAGNNEDKDMLSSDADSFSSGADVQEENCSPTLKGDVTARIPRLELHAYRRTLMLIHASGSLSWEQEDLLTNLRMSLHISNDEHLIEGQGWRLACLASKFQSSKDDGYLMWFILSLMGTVDTSCTKAEASFQKVP